MALELREMRRNCAGIRSGPFRSPHITQYEWAGHCGRSNFEIDNRGIGIDFSAELRYWEGCESSNDDSFSITMARLLHWPDSAPAPLEEGLMHWRKIWVQRQEGRAGEIEQGNIQVAAADLHPDRERAVRIQGDRL
jgi:hypothetical protein